MQRSNSSRERWDEKYRRMGPERRPPAGLLVSCGHLLPDRGVALDVGGGSGRNAVWLARRGLAVTVADISPVGLSLARDHARAAGVALTAEIRDVEADGLPRPPTGSPGQEPSAARPSPARPRDAAPASGQDAGWDVIVCFHFLWRPLFALAPAVLDPGGLLVFAQPTVRNLERHERPGRAYLLEEGELGELVAGLGLEIVRLQEGWNPEGRHEAELVARRPEASRRAAPAGHDSP